MRNSQFEVDLCQMRRALTLARRGVGLTAPNPAVGCVILDSQGEVCGEGWHEFERRDHAEIVALKAAGERASGGTAYVTLEPCNHTGRTGPCSEALIAAGLRRVIAATVDPNPAVAGAGLEKMRVAGVEVEVGICQDEARRLKEAFARWILSRRPFVQMKVAMTLDGRIAPAPGAQPMGQPFWISGEQSRQAVQLLRHEADAILTGIETALADDPLLTDRSGMRRRRPLLRVVLDSKLRLPLDSKLVKSAQGDLVVFTVSGDAARAEALRQRGVRVEVLPAQAERVPIAAVLETLGGEEILSVLTECGSRLNTALLAGGYVDRLQCFIAPRLLGGGAFPAFSALPVPIDLKDCERSLFGDDLSLSSLLRDPWPKI